MTVRQDQGQTGTGAVGVNRNSGSRNMEEVNTAITLRSGLGTGKAQGQALCTCRLSPQFLSMPDQRSHCGPQATVCRCRASENSWEGGCRMGCHHPIPPFPCQRPGPGVCSYLHDQVPNSTGPPPHPGQPGVQPTLATAQLWVQMPSLLHYVLLVPLPYMSCGLRASA